MASSTANIRKIGIARILLKYIEKLIEKLNFEMGDKSTIMLICKSLILCNFGDQASLDLANDGSP